MLGLVDEHAFEPIDLPGDVDAVTGQTRGASPCAGADGRGNEQVDLYVDVDGLRGPATGFQMPMVLVEP